ncbi:GDP-mannose 4,6-dehydratase [Tepidibacillus marianensis]|uniref:GDP-mannose 4,6-dehydratase n=1 Tax=Tepidibacillus marianensis TaxID=3131995 RepID=UPI0030D112AC
MTYAENLENLKDISENSSYTFIKADISDKNQIEEIFRSYDIDALINFATESHVDKSIDEQNVFLTSNVIGTQVLLDVAKMQWNFDFITENHIVKNLPFKPDVIITYWTKFAFNQKLVYKLSRTFEVPVLCFMMDMAPMTGGCHYANDCERYRGKCGSCLTLNSDKDRDLSKGVFFQKRIKIQDTKWE